MQVIEKKTTPMMEQWVKCKEKAKSAILLFRLGDFYEAFYDDASLISEVLELTLTQRHGIPMSGIPWHTSDTYIDKLIAKGFKVAIAEQLEDPLSVKGIVKRDIVKILSPGTVITSSVLKEKCNNYILSINQTGSIIGIAFLDISTGQFHVEEFDNLQDILNELSRIQPAEIITSNKFSYKNSSFMKEIQEILEISIFLLEDWRFDHKIASTFLINHFKTINLDGFGLKGMVSAINAAGALLAYIQEDLSSCIHHISNITVNNTSQHMLIDRTSQLNLEILESSKDKKTNSSLKHIIDLTLTPMGGRFLRNNLIKPLLSVSEINKRQDSIEFMFYQNQHRQHIRKLLKTIKDIERLLIKIETKNISPRDLLTLKTSILSVIHIKQHLTSLNLPQLLKESIDTIADFSDLFDLLNKAIVDEPPLRVSEGYIFKSKFNKELDDLRLIMSEEKQWLANYQEKLQNELGIKKLKVSFNKIHGYYIEVTKSQAPLMPDTFQRRQTRINSERFISPDLKEFEEKILHAEENVFYTEQKLFQDLCLEIISYKKNLLISCSSIANIDFICALAKIAKQNNYSRPIVDFSEKLILKEARHPVIETFTGKNTFIANDLDLDGVEKRMILITGPNMAGKSTYIRQTAVLVILAQIGSFIPASYAHIGIVDRIFTRIGANDDLSKGQSTFMLEMTETAFILNNTTNRSLIILDEIGRGTSTYDGLSIAWSVAEYLLYTEGKKAKTLFATHYWELTSLEKICSAVINYHAAVKEDSNTINFLYKIIQGGTNKSYGIHVAKIAGFPISVVTRAQEILKKLEQDKDQSSKNVKKSLTKDIQLKLFE